LGGAVTLGSGRDVDGAAAVAGERAATFALGAAGFATAFEAEADLVVRLGAELLALLLDLPADFDAGFLLLLDFATDTPTPFQ
jgi:hypothetical protein